MCISIYTCAGIRRYSPVLDCPLLFGLLWKRRSVVLNSSPAASFQPCAVRSAGPPLPMDSSCKQRLWGKHTPRLQVCKTIVLGSSGNPTDQSMRATFHGANCGPVGLSSQSLFQEKAGGSLYVGGSRAGAVMSHRNRTEVLGI